MNPFLAERLRPLAHISIRGIDSGADDADSREAVDQPDVSGQTRIELLADTCFVMKIFTRNDEVGRRAGNVQLLARDTALVEDRQQVGGRCRRLEEDDVAFACHPYDGAR